MQQLIKTFGYRSFLRVDLSLKLLVFLLFLFLCFNYLSTDGEKLRAQTARSNRHLRFRTKQNVTIATVACGSRFEEALLLIKSALIFGRNVELNFIVFVDDMSRKIMKGMLKNLKKKAKGYDFWYEVIEAQFPKGEEAFWKSMFAPCSTQRLFFPTVLPFVDSLLYMDSDTLFLSDVRDVWRFTEEMSKGMYIGAMAPEHEITGEGWYNLHSAVPYYHKRGLNAGILLMNLTRMREVNLVPSVHKILRQYSRRLVWADQDILNIYFHFHPEQLLEIGCEYNYRAQHCQCQYGGDCSCRRADQEGARIIHGNSRVFHSGKFLSFQTIYDAFRDFRIESETVENLLQKIEESFEALDETPCSKINENRTFFNHMITYISGLTEI